MRILAVLLLVATPVQATDVTLFESPSGNIACMLAEGEGNWASCEIADFVPSFTQRPADCDLDWGHMFTILAGAEGAILDCAGDTLRGNESQVLDYGQSITGGSVTCRSERAGMLCENSEGHGFRLSRNLQSVF